jgi:hypothetical protein
MIQKGGPVTRGTRSALYSRDLPLSFKPNTTEWRAAGELLGEVERSVSWWLGEWWAFGEARRGLGGASISNVPERSGRSECFRIVPPAGQSHFQASRRSRRGAPAQPEFFTDSIQVGLKLQRDSSPEYLCLMKEQIHQGHQNDS